MDDRRILTIQDISCVGQCSITVALPILSACGLETAVLPSAVLSTHTGGFTGYTFRDLTEDMPRIAAHWKKEGIRFDAIYTGYLGSAEQVCYVREIRQAVGKAECVFLVDPAMADNGVLYPGFDDAFVDAMRSLCTQADYILPNLTEACLMTSEPYRTQYDEIWIAGLLSKLSAICSGTIVLTGVGYTKDTTGVAVCTAGQTQYYCHKRLSGGAHGTGDVFASVFTGALLRGFDAAAAARLAADFTLCCIEATVEDQSHWYGVKFEAQLPKLIQALESK